MADLFEFFNHMNKSDLDYVDQMTDEEVKKISPFVVSMWISGATTNQPEHVLLSDVYCNPYLFSLSKHPRLLLKLFVAANGGIGNNDRYKFESFTTKKEEKSIRNIAAWYQCGIHEAKQYREILDKKDIEAIQEALEQ